MSGEQNGLDLRHLLSFQISQLNSLLNAQERAVLARRGSLSPAQWRILRLVGQGVANTTTTVRKMTGIDKSQFSKTLSALVDDGLVEVSAFEQDKRQMLIVLNKKGRAAYRQLLPDLDARHEYLMAALNEEEQRLIFSAIKALSAAAERTDFSNGSN